MVAAVVMQHSRPGGCEMKGYLAKQHTPLHEHHLGYSKLWGEEKSKEICKEYGVLFLYVLPNKQININLLKTSPEYTLAWVYEECVL